MAEVFVNIDGFPKYQVSNFGKVKNITTDRILKGSKNNKGYFFVTLSNCEDTSHKLIHRLVANAFLENPEDKKCVDHQDRDRTNNNVNNLRFATYTENNQNVSIRYNNKSGVIGVSFNTKDKKWRATICVNGNDIYLGSFTEKDDAIRARQEAEILHFGEFRST